MNFAQMREAFFRHTGITDTPDNTELALWFNEAQLDLAWELGPVQSITLENGSCRLPENCLTLLGGDRPYRVNPLGEVMAEEGGSLTLYYRTMPREFTGLEDEQESQLHSGLHYLLPLFAASRYWDKEAEGDGEEINQSNRWLSYYYQGKNLAKTRLFGKNEPMDAWEIRG